MAEESEKPGSKADEAVDEEEEEEDLEKLQAEIARMEAEAERITKEAEELDKKKKDAEAKRAGTSAAAAPAAGGDGSKPARDNYSIYVGQVDYSTTPEELLAHFEACGTVERVTIVCDKFTGKPKGFAYLEFENESSVENALKLDESEFKGRQLKITHKRVNQPGMAGGPPRGRGGFRGRGGGFRGRGGGYRGGFRGRGRGGGGYHPYY